MNSSLAHVRALIASGKIREAMGMLKELSKGRQCYDEVLQYYARNTEIEDQLRNALITVESARRDKARIRQALLAIVSKLEEGGAASGFSG